MTTQIKFAAVLLLAAMPLPAQTPAPADRGTGTRPAAAAPAPPGHRYVVAIGVNHYANWPVLGTAVSDATGFAELLHEQFGYELVVPPIVEKDATRHRIESVIDDELRGKLKPGDDLIVFFAGHGTTRTDKVGDIASSTGFLVPVEAHAPGTDEHWSDYIKVDEFLRNLSDLPARHILVILDSCHSGLALGSSFKSSRGYERYEADVANRISRKVITSAQGDQTAADQGPVPNHSLFTGLLIQGLKTGKADNYNQGFVTASQLGAFVQHEVGVAEGARQTPLFGSFYLDDSGELTLPLTKTQQVRLPPKSYLVQANMALWAGQSERFLQLADKVDKASLSPYADEWLKYQRTRLTGDTPETRAELASLDFALRWEEIPDYLTSGEMPFLIARREALRFCQTLPLESGIVVTVNAHSPAMETKSFQADEQGRVHLPKDAVVTIDFLNESDKPVFVSELILLSVTGQAETSIIGLSILPHKAHSETFEQQGGPEEIDVHLITSPSDNGRGTDLLHDPSVRQTVVKLLFGE